MIFILPAGYSIKYAVAKWLELNPDKVMMVHTDDVRWTMWCRTEQQAHYYAWLHRRGERAAALPDRQWYAWLRILGNKDAALAQRCADGIEDERLCAVYRAHEMVQRYDLRTTTGGRLLGD
jgi:hypothetical protein